MGHVREGRRLTALLGLAMLAAALTACAGSSGKSTVLPTRHPSVVGTATGSVEKLTWALPAGEPNTIDPPNTAYYSSALVAMNLCESLLRLNADYSITDGLASLSTPEPTRLRLTLKRGVTFWDGSPLTAADVVWSLEHARASIAGFSYGNVGQIRAVGSDVVEITLTKPDSLFPKELASFAGAVMEKKFSEAAGDKLGTPNTGVMCTGPYKFDSWKSGASIELSANDHYWDKASAAHAQKVSLRFFTDSTALGTALKAGEVDGAYEVPAALIPSLVKSDAGRLTLGSPGQQYVGLSPMRTDGPLHSPELRKAFYMTIDRQDLAKGPFKGAAKANYTALNVSAWNNASMDPSATAVWREAYQKFASERAAWGSADAIKAARKVAEQAGYDGSPITLAIPAGDETFKLIALLIQADAQKAGFNVKIMPLQPIAYADAAANPKSRAGIDLYLNLSFNVAPDPAEPVATFLPGTYFNFINYNDPEVSKLIAEAGASSDPVEAAKDLVEAQARYEENYGFQALVEVNEVSFLKNGLGGATASFAYLNQPSLAKIGADHK